MTDHYLRFAKWFLVLLCDRLRMWKIGTIPSSAMNSSSKQTRATKKDGQEFGRSRHSMKISKKAIFLSVAQCHFVTCQITNPLDKKWVKKGRRWMTRRIPRTSMRNRCEPTRLPLLRLLCKRTSPSLIKLHRRSPIRAPSVKWKTQSLKAKSFRSHSVGSSGGFGLASDAF